MENILGRIFTEDECRNILNSLDNVEWKRFNHNIKEENFVCDYYLIEYNENEFVTNAFKNIINSSFSFKVDTVNIFLLKYLTGGSFGRHTDRKSSSEHHKDYIYNINVLLNDEFEGGEFYLNDTKLEGNTPGIAYTYNSFEFHEVKPVTSGIRYSMLCYVRERDFITKEKKSLI